MTDYTDIELILELAKGKLLLAQQQIWKYRTYAKFADEIEADAYENRFNEILSELDHLLDETNNYTDLIEKGMKWELLTTTRNMV